MAFRFSPPQLHQEASPCRQILKASPKSPDLGGCLGEHLSPFVPGCGHRVLHPSEPVTAGFALSYIENRHHADKVIGDDKKGANLFKVFIPLSPATLPTSSSI